MSSDRVPAAPVFLMNIAGRLVHTPQEARNYAVLFVGEEKRRLLRNIREAEKEWEEACRRAAIHIEYRELVL